MEILNEIKTAVFKGNVKGVTELVNRALSENVEPKAILEEGMLPAMTEIGELFAQNKVFIPQVMIAAKAMNTGSEILKPYMKGDASAKGVAIIGTVKGDQHDIGKNLVKMMLEGQGIEVTDLGINVTAEKFIAAAKEKDADLICCSALLTTTMPVMQQVVDLRNSEGIRAKVMVGGAPVTQEFCDKIGADAYSKDAASAAALAVQLCQK